MGQGTLAVLHASQPQPPPPEAILTAVLNDLAALPERLLLVLDDYHAIDAPADVEPGPGLSAPGHPPPPLHLVIASREDPTLPLARTSAPTGRSPNSAPPTCASHRTKPPTFLDPVMGLHLSASNIAALEVRTEGWIAGLQLAATLHAGTRRHRPLLSRLSPVTTASCWTI